MAVYAGSCEAPDGSSARVCRLDRADLSPLAPAVPAWMLYAASLDSIPDLEGTDVEAA